MRRSRAGWSVAHFRNNNHDSVRPSLLHTCPFSASGGKLVATISLSCIGNSWLVVTPNRIGRSTSNSFACFQKGRRTPQKERASLHLLCLLGRRRFSSFVDLKNWRQRNKKRSSHFDTCIQKSIWPMTSFSSLLKYYARAQANSSTPGLITSEPARSANYKALW